MDQRQREKDVRGRIEVLRQGKRHGHHRLQERPHDHLRNPKLSEADRTFLEENGKAAADAADPADVEASLKGQKIGKPLAKKGILSKLEGEKFANFQLEKAPQYYLVYFSASW